MFFLFLKRLRSFLLNEKQPLAKATRLHLQKHFSSSNKLQTRQKNKIKVTRTILVHLFHYSTIINTGLVKSKPLIHHRAVERLVSDMVSDNGVLVLARRMAAVAGLLKMILFLNEKVLSLYGSLPYCCHIFKTI